MFYVGQEGQTLTNLIVSYSQCQVSCASDVVVVGTTGR